MAGSIVAIDQGTTSSRCIIFNHQGHVVSSAQLEHAQHYPQQGWVEHDPLEIWQRCQEVIKIALSADQVQREDIKSIGITNQRETTVVWDKLTGRPFYPAIVWQDTRTKTFCDQLAANGGQDRFRQKTGLPLATYFAGPKISWILENVPQARKSAESGEALFGTMDTWLIWWLTGGPGQGAHVTDVTNASRTLLMNLDTLNWDDELLSIMRIPRSMLPRIVSSSDPKSWGVTRKNGPFEKEIPICGALGDQQAALVGQTCFNPGEAKNTYGTGCFMLMNTGEIPVPSTSGLLTTVAYQFHNSPAAYALEGSIAVAGALVQWLRDNLGMIEKSQDVETLALTVEDNGGIYIVPAFSGLFAPYWRSDARGVVVGLTRYVNKAHFARAVLEATAFQTEEVLNAMEQDSGVKLTSLRVDGGMVQNQLLMQFQSDILDVPVVRPKIAETTALGAAYAAGLAVGFWDSLDDLRRNWQIDQTWQPAMDENHKNALKYGWKKAVERTFNWIE